MCPGFAEPESVQVSPQPQHQLEHLEVLLLHICYLNLSVIMSSLYLAQARLLIYIATETMISMNTM